MPNLVSPNQIFVNTTQAVSNTLAYTAQASTVGQQFGIAAASFPALKPNVQPTDLPLKELEVRPVGGELTPLEVRVYEGDTNDVKTVDLNKNTPSTTPEQTRGKNTSSPNILSFPEDIDNVKYFITFRFSETFNRSPFEKPTDKFTDIIRLPMPSSLVEKFSMGYSSQGLGTIVGGLMDTGVPKDIYDILKNSNGKVTDEAISTIRGRVAEFKENAGVENIILPAIRVATTLFSDTASKAADIVTGTALNPYQSLFFEGPELRTHDFSFRLSPNSESESYRLRNIINIFRKRMLPEKDLLVYRYPDSCFIELTVRGNSMSLYTIYRSYLKSIAVNYAPSNTPAFFKNGYDPVEVALDLSFSEINPVTRNDVDTAVANDLINKQGAVL